MYYILLFVLFIIIYILYYYNNKKNYQKRIDEILTSREEEILSHKRQHFQERLEELTIQNQRNIDAITKAREELVKQADQAAADKKEQLRLLDINLESTNRQLRVAQENLNQYKTSMQAAIDEQLKSYESTQRDSIKLQIEAQKQQQTIELENQRAAVLKQIDDEFNKKMQSAQSEYEKTQTLQAEQIQNANNTLENLRQQIEEYSNKQTAINEAIMRQRELEEQQDFYRICLSNEAKSDINYLISIVPNFKNPTAIYKLIWSEYIQKQFNQMVKNVLGTTDPKNVIYSITNLKTNEIYIGKTKAEVSKRWGEHIKSSLNIGTIKSAKIHEALYNHWDEYAFAVVEKVSPDQNLSEREKFYIDFYKSNIYGYNLKSGG